MEAFLYPLGGVKRGHATWTPPKNAITITTSTISSNEHATWTISSNERASWTPSMEAFLDPLGGVQRGHASWTPPNDAITITTSTISSNDAT